MIVKFRTRHKARARRPEHIGPRGDEMTASGMTRSEANIVRAVEYATQLKDLDPEQLENIVALMRTLRDGARRRLEDGESEDGA